MSNNKNKSKSDKSKSPPPLTVCYTNVRGLRGNFTDLEAFMHKNKPDIFALCETNLHDRHTLSLPKCRTGYYTSSFFPRTATIECFPADYDLTAFKGRVNKFLLQQ